MLHSTSSTSHPSNHIYYLDATNENGSLTILKQLNIQLTSSTSTPPSSSSSHVIDITNKNHYLYKEIKYSNTSIQYFIHSTCISSLYLDIRDHGDCWLRICLLPNDSIIIPSNLYHKFYTNNIHQLHEYSLSFLLHEYPHDKNLSNYCIPRYNVENDTLQLIHKHTYRELICELCSQFYNSGWVTGTGGSISIRYGNRIYMTPSGVQKERILPDELFLLDIDGNFLSLPPQKIPGKLPKLSDCSPLFLHSYRLRNAGAVLHSHDITCVLVTAITTSNEFKISHQEMIKGIAGYGYHDELIVPIIENTAWESELADSLERAIIMYPKTYAVLVRDHGIYVWGDTWEQAKRHGECLHYLFNVAIQKHNMHLTPIYSHLQSSIDYDKNMEQEDNDRKRRRTGHSHGNGNGNGHGDNENSIPTDLIHKSCDICNLKSLNTHHYASGYKYLVFDIEGTTTPITFVKDVLFPYARDNFQSHMKNTWNDVSTQEDIQNLCNQAKDDLINFPQKDSLPIYLSQMIELATPPTPPSSAVLLFNEELLQYLTQYVHWCIDLDRKISALKLLQGKIWRNGYEANTLQSIVYPDVPQFFSKMKRLGAQIYIYSSGSMEAQRLLFKYSNYGDLRPFLSGYFDTSIGHKRQSQSYTHIFRSLGADNPHEILFVTDIIEEGYAAKEAGFNVVLSNRPGNATFPSNPPFPIVTSFDML